MKRTLSILIIFMILQTNSFSQVYQPIGIDTSCYWINQGSITDGIQNCTYESVLVVLKDTSINGNLYHKCMRYLTMPPSCNPPNSYLANYINTVDFSLLREDTLSRVLLSYSSGNDDTLINFNLNVSDSIKSCNSINSPMTIIDSVSTESFNLINRRVAYSTFQGYLGTHYIYKIIEGIGSNQGLSCPADFNSLICYSKHGIEYYNSTMSNCPRPAPLKIQDIDKQELNIYFYNNQLFIENPLSRELKIELYNLSGQLVVSVDTKKTSSNLNMNHLPEGIYIANIKSSGEIKRLKIKK